MPPEKFKIDSLNDGLNDKLNKFERGISLVSWAYNEEKIIESFIRKAHSLMESVANDFEILIVDDGSTDKTPEILQRLQKEFPRLKIITHQTNLNVGVSCKDAVHGASKEFVFWQTSDWSYDLTHIRLFLELLWRYDVVAGVRRSPVSSIKSRIPKIVLLILQVFGINHITRRSDTVKKAFVSLINYFLIRALFRFPMSDFQNVVFYRTNLIQQIKPESVSSFTNPEFLFRAYHLGARIVEVPIGFLPRKEGQAKGTRLGSIFRSLKDIFRFWFKWIILRKLPSKKKGQIDRLNYTLWKTIEAEPLLSKKINFLKQHYQIPHRT